MISLYVPAGLMRMIKQLCIAGWSEQGGVEEGEASPVHDPQVLQGEQIIFQQYIKKYNIRYMIWWSAGACFSSHPVPMFNVFTTIWMD